MEAKKKAAHEEKTKKEQEVDALKKKMASTQLSESEMAIGNNDGENKSG